MRAMNFAASCRKIFGAGHPAGEWCTSSFSKLIVFGSSRRPSSAEAGIVASSIIVFLLGIKKAALRGPLAEMLLVEMAPEDAIAFGVGIVTAELIAGARSARHAARHSACVRLGVLPP